MPNAIILHGTPSREEYYDLSAPSMSNAHWLPWLQAQLLKADIGAWTPEVPRSFDRVWSTWVEEFERYDLGTDTMFIGHSTGAGFFLKYLSIHADLSVGRVILVAPWVDPFHASPGFLDDISLDPDVADRTAGLTVFYSDNDQESIQQSLAIMKDTLSGVTYRAFHNYGHFCSSDMHSTTFPELLEELLSPPA